jgi:pilus assembly protein CpaE
MTVTSDPEQQEPDTTEDVLEDGPRLPGQVVVVFSPKGGTGKTVISANLALALSAGGGRRVCLVDLDLEFGDIAISLGLTPSRNLIDAVDQSPSMSEEDQVAALVTSWQLNLDCVLAPVDPGDAERISPALVGSLLRRLKQRYEYVVVDTPAQFSECVLEALDVAEHHVLITTPEIPALKNLRLTLDMLELLSYGQVTRTVVLNRADPKAGLSVEDAANAIKTGINASIPASFDVTASINAGVPLSLSHPEHPVSLAVQALADRAITGTPATVGRRNSRFGLKLRMRTS